MILGDAVLKLETFVWEKNSPPFAAEFRNGQRKKQSL